MIERRDERAFSFIPLTTRPHKPRKTGMTEIRGPYYTPMGRRYLEDILETMHPYVDGLKFAGGSFALMPRERVRELIELAHRHDVYVSTGGWIEHVLRYGADAVAKYIAEARAIGFDVVELSAGFVTLSADDLLRLIERVRRAGLKAKPALGIQFGAGGATPEPELKAEGFRDAHSIISRAKACLDAGANVIMIESEGITESAWPWRTDVVSQLIDELGLEKLMFEAADPPVFEWYLKNYGIDANLFVDHSHIVQLECLRSGIWGTKSTWGRMMSYREQDDQRLT
jgi:phosphosulfolactate synthase (CoM biosynthesis protein A)